MTWRWWLIGLLCVSAVAGVLESEKTPAGTGRAFSQDVVEVAVRAKLRDPQSAIFRDLSATNDRKIGTMKAGLIVCGYVNAKNGFGGYTGDKMFITFYRIGTADIEPTPPTRAFSASWNALCAG
jgi:hypothetical protein